MTHTKTKSMFKCMTKQAFIRNIAASLFSHQSNSDSQPWKGLTSECKELLTVQSNCEISINKMLRFMCIIHCIKWDLIQIEI